MPIDLNADARRGQPFALPWEAGGTARVDGRAYGVIVRARVSNPGGSLFDGDVVRLRTNGGSFPDVQPSATLEEPVFGVVVDPTFQGVANGLMCDVLVVGFHPHVKITGSASQYQYLKASGTAGAATAVAVATTPNIFGQTTGPSSGGYVAATILSQPLYVGVHRQLGVMHGLERHTDLIEGQPPYDTASIFSGLAQTLTDVDPDTFVNVWPNASFPFDLGPHPIATAGFKVRLRDVFAGSGPTSWIVRGSDVPDFSTSTVLFTGSSILGTEPTDFVGYWAPTTFRYYRIEYTGGGDRWYTISLYEAAGQHLIVKSGDSAALLDDVLAPIDPIATTAAIDGTKHVHAIGEEMIGDGMTTSFYLANEAEPDTVAAFVDGSRDDVTLSGMNDVITFDSAPGANAKIRVDYLPVLI